MRDKMVIYKNDRCPFVSIQKYLRLHAIQTQFNGAEFFANLTGFSGITKKIIEFFCVRSDIGGGVGLSPKFYTDFT